MNKGDLKANVLTHRLFLRQKAEGLGRSLVQEWQCQGGKDVPIILDNKGQHYRLNYARPVLYGGIVNTTHEQMSFAHILFQVQHEKEITRLLRIRKRLDELNG